VSNVAAQKPKGINFKKNSKGCLDKRETNPYYEVTSEKVGGKIKYIIDPAVICTFLDI
jgi:hypothetical protein